VRKRYISVLILFLISPLINSTPAFATDTRTAVNACINTEGCNYDCEATEHGVDCLIYAPNGAIIHCDYGQCGVVYRPNISGAPVKKPVNVTPIITGKPVQAAPPKGGKPPTKGGHPINAAPIKGKPVQASPTDPSHPVILERAPKGGGGKH
jgi:hypothetical protein